MGTLHLMLILMLGLIHSVWSLRPKDSYSEEIQHLLPASTDFVIEEGGDIRDEQQAEVGSQEGMQQLALQELSEREIANSSIERRVEQLQDMVKCIEKARKLMLPGKSDYMDQFTWDQFLGDLEKLAKAVPKVPSLPFIPYSVHGDVGLFARLSAEGDWKRTQEFKEHLSTRDSPKKGTMLWKLNYIVTHASPIPEENEVFKYGSRPGWNSALLLWRHIAFSRFLRWSTPEDDPTAVAEKRWKPVKIESKMLGIIPHLVLYTQHAQELADIAYANPELTAKFTWAPNYDGKTEEAIEGTPKTWLDRMLAIVAQLDPQDFFELFELCAENDHWYRHGGDKMGNTAALAVQSAQWYISQVREMGAYPTEVTAPGGVDWAEPERG